MARQPWEDDELVTQPARSPVVQITPPNRQPPLARPDQARGEAAGAELSEYEVRTRPEREARTDRRAEEGQQFTQRQQVLNAWATNPQVRQFQEARTAYYSLRNLQANPNGVNAVATIFAFMKALDPGSTVREGEAATAQNSGGIPAAIVNAYNQALSGNGLTDSQRRQMVMAAGDILNARAMSYNEATHRAREQLRGIGGAYDEIRTQLPLSAAPGAHGYELENRQRQSFGLEALPDPAERVTTTDAREGAQAVQFPSLNQNMITLNPNDLFASPEDWAYRNAWVEMLNQRPTREQAQAWLNENFPRIYHGQAGPQIPDDLWRAIEESQRTGQGLTWNPTPTGRNMEEGENEEARRQQAEVAAGPLAAAVVGSSQGTSLGFGDEAAAALVGGAQTLGGEGSFGENFNHNLTRFQEGQEALRQEHPLAYGGGEIAGSLALPTGAINAGRNAAISAMRSGLSRAEATAIARDVVARRLAVEGMGYGAAHGAGAAEGDVVDRATAAAMEAAIGYAGGRALPRLDPARVAGRRPSLPPLVNPVTERINEPLEYASPGQRADAFSEFGITPPMGAVTDRGGAIVEAALDNNPVSAGMMNDARRLTGEQVENAAEGVASRYGGSRGFQQQGEAAQRGARSWIERAQGAQGDRESRGVVGRAYDAIPIRPETTAQTPNTLAALRQINQRFASNEGIAAERRNPVFQRYQEALEGGTISWQDLKAFRSDIGEEIGRARFSDGASEGQLRALYGALSEDMRATAEAIGPSALRRFERANNLNRQVEERIEGALTSILGNDARQNPERAAAVINGLIRSGRGSANIQRLAEIRASTIKGGEWNEISSAIMRDMGQPANSAGRAFDPAVFVRNYSDMTAEARNLLFGASNRPLREALDRFVAVNQRLTRRNSLRNTSNTAPNLIGAGIIYTLANNPGALVATGATAYGLGKAWTNPGFVNLVTRLASVGSNRLSDRQIASIRRQMARVARSSPAIAAEVSALDQSLFGTGHDTGDDSGRN